MTATEMVNKFVGKQGTITQDGLTFNVKTVDVRTAFGQTQILITPISGLGQRWIQAAAFKAHGSTLHSVTSLVREAF